MEIYDFNESKKKNFDIVNFIHNYSSYIQFKYDFDLFFNCYRSFIYFRIYAINKKYFLKKNIIFINKFVLHILYIYLYFYVFLFLNSRFKNYTFTLLMGCIASDIGGYLFGKILQGPKLTKISQKKLIQELLDQYF